MAHNKKDDSNATKVERNPLLPTPPQNLQLHPDALAALSRRQLADQLRDYANDAFCAAGKLVRERTLYVMAECEADHREGYAEVIDDLNSEIDDLMEAAQTLVNRARAHELGILDEYEARCKEWDGLRR